MRAHPCARTHVPTVTEMKRLGERGGLRRGIQPSQRNRVDHVGRVDRHVVHRLEREHDRRGGGNGEPEAEVEGCAAIGRPVLIPIEEAEADRDGHQDHGGEEEAPGPALHEKAKSHGNTYGQTQSLCQAFNIANPAHMWTLMGGGSV